MTDKLRHTRIKLSEANAFVAEHHRHHKPVIGHLFSIGAVIGDQLVGVAIVGRPVARMRDDGATAEVTRLKIKGFHKVVPHDEIYRSRFPEADVDA